MPIKRYLYLLMGKKGSEILAKTNQVVSSHDALFDELTYSKVSEVAQQVMDQFAEKAYDEVVLVYNRFKNAATQIVQRRNRFYL